MKYSAGTKSVPSVSTTAGPTVKPPTNTNTAISADAARIESTPLPVAGPNATPVEDPPTFTPTNTAGRDVDDEQGRQRHSAWIDGADRDRAFRARLGAAAGATAFVLREAASGLDPGAVHVTYRRARTPTSRPEDVERWLDFRQSVP